MRRKRFCKCSEEGKMSQVCHIVHDFEESFVRACCLLNVNFVYFTG